MTFAIFKTAIKDPDFKSQTIGLAAKKHKLSVAVVKNLYLKCLYEVLAKKVRKPTEKSYKVAIATLGQYEYKLVRDELHVKCLEKVAQDKATKPAKVQTSKAAITQDKATKLKTDRKLTMQEAWLLGACNVLIALFPDANLVVKDEEISFTIDNKRESVKSKFGLMAAGSFISLKIRNSKRNKEDPSNVLTETIKYSQQDFKQLDFNYVLKRYPELTSVMALFLPTEKDYLIAARNIKWSGATSNAGSKFPIGARIAVKESGKYSVGTVVRSLPDSIEIAFDAGRKETVVNLSEILVLPANTVLTKSKLTEKEVSVLANLTKLKG